MSIRHSSQKRLPFVKPRGKQPDSTVVTAQDQPTTVSQNASALTTSSQQATFGFGFQKESTNDRMLRYKQRSMINTQVRVRANEALQADDVHADVAASRRDLVISWGVDVQTPLVQRKPIEAARSEAREKVSTAYGFSANYTGAISAHQYSQGPPKISFANSPTNSWMQPTDIAKQLHHSPKTQRQEIDDLRREVDRLVNSLRDTRVALDLIGDAAVPRKRRRAVRNDSDRLAIVFFRYFELKNLASSENCPIPTRWVTPTLAHEIAATAGIQHEPATKYRTQDPFGLPMEQQHDSHQALIRMNTMFGGREVQLPVPIVHTHVLPKNFKVDELDISAIELLQATTKKKDVAWVAGVLYDRFMQCDLC